MTECSPPSRITWETDEKQGHFVNTFVLTSSGARTRVERTFVVPKQKGVMLALFPSLSIAYVQPTLRKGLNKFKQNLEGGGGTASPAS